MAGVGQLSRKLKANWSSDSVVHILSPTLVESIVSGFHTLEAEVKMRLLLAFMGLDENKLSAVKGPLTHLITQAAKDNDEWVQTIARLCSEWLSLGEIPSDRENFVQEAVSKVVKAGMIPSKDGGESQKVISTPYFAPLEEQFLSKSQQPTSSEFINVDFHANYDPLAEYGEDLAGDLQFQASQNIAGGAGESAAGASNDRVGSRKLSASASSALDGRKKTPFMTSRAGNFMGVKKAVVRSQQLKSKVMTLNLEDMRQIQESKASAACKKRAANGEAKSSDQQEKTGFGDQSAAKKAKLQEAGLETSETTEDAAQAVASPKLADTPSAMVLPAAADPAAHDEADAQHGNSASPEFIKGRSIESVTGEKCNALKDKDRQLITMFFEGKNPTPGKTEYKVKFNEETTYDEATGEYKKETLYLNLSYVDFKWKKTRKMKVIKGDKAEGVDGADTGEPDN